MSVRCIELKKEVSFSNNKSIKKNPQPRNDIKDYSEEEKGQEGTSLKETSSKDKVLDKSNALSATKLATSKLTALSLRKISREVI